MANKRIAGTCFVKLNGGQLPLEGEVTVQFFPVKREGKAGPSGINGFKEMPVVPFIEVECAKVPDHSLAALSRMTDGTVQADCADGTTYVLRNAWHCGETNLNVTEGNVKHRFEGMSCMEIAA